MGSASLVHALQRCNTIDIRWCLKLVRKFGLALKLIVKRFLQILYFKLYSSLLLFITRMHDVRIMVYDKHIHSFPEANF